MQDPPSGTVPGFVYMHRNGFREVMQNGREGNTLHGVPIRRVDGSPEGRTSLQTSLCHFFVDMHHNGFREVMQNGSERKILHAVHI